MTKPVHRQSGKLGKAKPRRKVTSARASPKSGPRPLSGKTAGNRHEEHLPSRTAEAVVGIAERVLQVTEQQAVQIGILAQQMEEIRGEVARLRGLVELRAQEVRAGIRLPSLPSEGQQPRGVRRGKG